MRKQLSILALLSLACPALQAQWLAWDDPNPATNQVISYSVYQSVSGAPLAILGTTTNRTWTLGALPAVVTQWCVTAVNVKGESPSACITYTPPAPPAPTPPPAPAPIPTPGPITNLRLGTNLVINGGFESGATGWTTTPTVSFGIAWSGVKPNSGASCATFGESNQTGGSVSQQLDTIVGTSYTLTFHVASAGAVLPMALAATVIGKTTLASQTVTVTASAAGVTYTTASLKFTADGPTVIQFRDVSTTSVGVDLLLDDVQVTSP